MAAAWRNPNSTLGQGWPTARPGAAIGNARSYWFSSVVRQNAGNGTKSSPDRQFRCFLFERTLDTTLFRPINHRGSDTQADQTPKPNTHDRAFDGYVKRSIDNDREDVTSDK